MAKKRMPKLSAYKGLIVQRDAALAANASLQRKLDAAAADLEATKTWCARVRAEADTANAQRAQERKEKEAEILRYATRENELRDRLKQAESTLLAHQWIRAGNGEWVRPADVACEPYGKSPGMLSREAARTILEGAGIEPRIAAAIVAVIERYLVTR